MGPSTISCIFMCHLPGWSVLVPAKSRHQDKQPRAYLPIAIAVMCGADEQMDSGGKMRVLARMTVEQRLLTLYVSSVMVEASLPW